MALIDVSGRFTFRQWTQGNYAYKEAAGELGIPGQVVQHRVVSAQRSMSAHSGEHAGHLIGIQFGAPGDARNMSLQNPNMNTFAPKALQEAFRGPGGSYHDLESRWAGLLKQGYRIAVTVCDKFHLGEARPFTRSVSWVETATNGVPAARQTLDFGNFGSPQQRAAGQP